MLTLAFAGSDEVALRPAGPPLNVWKTPAGAVFARGFRAGETGWLDWDGLGLFAFECGSRVVRVCAVPGARPDAVLDMFERVIQPVVLQALGWEALHGSATLTPGGGVVVFCGIGHSGKSTLAYALGRTSGWRQVADDAVVIARGTEVPAVELLPFRPKLRPASARFFSGPALTKATAAAEPSAPRATRAPLQSIVMLAQSPDASELPSPEHIAPAKAFTELLTHAHSFDPADRQAAARMVHTYLHLASRVPVIRVTYRPNLDRLPALVESLDRFLRPIGGRPLMARV